MIDGLRAGVLMQLGQRVERDQRAVGRLEVEQRKRVRIGLILRLQFQQDLVFVDGRVNGGDPARAVGVVERVLDGVGVHLQRRGLIAIDGDVDLRRQDRQDRW